MFQSIRLPPRGGNLLENAELFDILHLDDLHARASGASARRRREITDLFQIAEIHNERPHIRNCISLSFFCQNCENTRPNEFPDRGGGSGAVEDFITYLAEIVEVAAAATGGWKVRVYMDSVAANAVSDAVAAAAVEIVIMKHTNVGAQPAGLWKFLVLEDAGLDIVYIMDWNGGAAAAAAAKIARFCQSPQNIILGRPFGVDIHAIDILFHLKRATDQMCFFPITEIMVNYILWKLCSCKSEAFWTTQSLDTQIVRRIFIPYVAVKGKMVSWTTEHIHKNNSYNCLEKTHPLKIEYNFCLNHNNLFSMI